MIDSAGMWTAIRELEQRNARLAQQVQQLQDQRAGKVVWPRVTIFLGKTDEAIAKGSIGTVSVYTGEESTETDTGENVECKNRFADVATGKWVAFTLIGSFHYLIAAECD